MVMGASLSLHKCVNPLRSIAKTQAQQDSEEIIAMCLHNFVLVTCKKEKETGGQGLPTGEGLEESPRGAGQRSHSGWKEISL